MPMEVARVFVCGNRSRGEGGGLRQDPRSKGKYRSHGVANSLYQAPKWPFKTDPPTILLRAGNIAVLPAELQLGPGRAGS